MSICKCLHTLWQSFRLDDVLDFSLDQEILVVIINNFFGSLVLHNRNLYSISSFLQALLAPCSRHRVIVLPLCKARKDYRKKSPQKATVIQFSARLCPDQAGAGTRLHYSLTISSSFTDSVSA
jgi:hypothetical protein